MIAIHLLLSQKVPSWVFGGVMNAPLWSNVFPKCHNDVKSILFVSFGTSISNFLSALPLYNSNPCNSIDQLHASYRPTQRRIQGTFNIFVEAHFAG